MTDSLALDRVLEPDSPSASMGFGVMALSQDGSVLVVGVPGTQEVLVYVDGELTATLTASDSASGDFFGLVVACSSDGSVVVVGAPFDNVGAGTDAGSVYVYSGANYATETKLVASDGGSSQFLGGTVSCSSDGSVVAASAAGNGSTGAAYVWSGTGWATEQKVVPAGTRTNDRFGDCAALSSDGSQLLVGAPFKTVSGDSYAGAAYLFSGANYATETMLTASDATSDKLFGQAVAFSSDASTIVIGQSADPTAGATEAGAAYILTGSGYSSQTRVAASDAAAFRTNFGHQVACSSDGSVVIVGAERSNHAALTRPGAAYVYSGSGWGTELKLVASDAFSDASFGARVAITDAGDAVYVYGNASVGGFSNVGAIYSDTEITQSAGWGLLL